MKIYIGDVGTLRTAKTLMPMLGGYFNISNFKIETLRRVSSGKLVSDVVATKKLITISFDFMLPEDYETWEAQQRLAEWREVEYEERDASYTKLTVNLVGNYGHKRFRVYPRWIYANVVFQLEEV